jgi:hypothetical protein
MKKNFTDVELAICDQFKLLSDKIGFEILKLSD